MSQTTYERLESLPKAVDLVVVSVARTINPDGSVYPTVRKDLEAYLQFLSGHLGKLSRATNALLIKPAVAAYLKGEEVAVEAVVEEEEGELADRLKAARRTLVELEERLARLAPGEEPPRPTNIPPVVGDGQQQ